ncbi:ABC-2 type transport system ATP-binding protein [Streptacidiphilus sp. MAP12-33]|uniref:ATP-binding cassette domain-containing protein n=1 Tax=Streptacidiphilus sp. MAP12-33 TaxID=3156266 RepID=UPI0035123C2D
MRLDGVGKRYGPRGPWVLREVGLTVERGALVRAVGGNGSGKSTLLRVLAGVARPTRGRIVDGYARRAYVPERFPAELPFTARDYLCHLGRLHGAEDPRVEELLERLGATGFAGRPLRELSKGSCQKVAVAQALLGEPELLVLDEAWTGLDQAARQTLDEEVGQRLARGTAVVFVDHDPARLAGRADAHWCVAEGRVRVDRDARSYDAETVVITVTGVPAARLQVLSGVTEAAELGDGALRLRVAAGASDALLRAVLAQPGAHVREVR